MGYVGGNDCKFYSNRDDVAENTPGNIKASIFSCLVPYEGNGGKDHMQSSSEFPNPMSITGRFENSVLKVLDDQQTSGPHYPSASFYSSFWRWVDAVSYTPPPSCAFLAQSEILTSLSPLSAVYFLRETQKRLIRTTRTRCTRFQQLSTPCATRDISKHTIHLPTSTT